MVCPLAAPFSVHPSYTAATRPPCRCTTVQGRSAATASLTLPRPRPGRFCGIWSGAASAAGSSAVKAVTGYGLRTGRALIHSTRTCCQRRTSIVGPGRCPSYVQTSVGGSSECKRTRCATIWTASVAGDRCRSHVGRNTGGTRRRSLNRVSGIATDCSLLAGCTTVSDDYSDSDRY